MNTCLREEVKPGESDTHPYGCDATEGNGLGEATSPFHRHEKRGVDGSPATSASTVSESTACPRLLFAPSGRRGLCRRFSSKRWRRCTRWGD